MFIKAYINTTKEIVEAYKGEEPLNSFLKKFFAQNKKFGSRDRKQVTHLCYCFFRLGKSLEDVNVDDKILIGLFLCSTTQNLLLEKIKPEWNDLAENSLEEKISTIKAHYSFDIKDVFSLRNHVSTEVDFDAFSKAIFFQPHTFLRVRPGMEAIVHDKLTKANITFERTNDHCLAVPPAIKLEEVVQVNKEVVIQDYSSQRISELFPSYQLSANHSQLSAWDCCAASGGKSILLKDYYPDIKLTVSDIRESILINLNKRFAQAGIRNYYAKVADVAADNFELKQKFDFIICDVPCTGSGTWGRTPEQLYFFDEERIGHYITLQRKIVRNAAKSLKKGSHLLYVTCSVFKEENEDAVAFVREQLQLRLVAANYFKGYHQRADTLFAALFVL